MSADQLSLLLSFEVKAPIITQADRRTPQASHIAKCYLDGKHSIRLRNFIDWGEPVCWACGYFRNASYCDVKCQQLHPNDSERNHPTRWLNCWNRAARSMGKGFLEKAHIIPHSLGGSSDPSNFVLLCKECHKDNPNTKSVKMYQSWIDSVQSWNMLTDRRSRVIDVERTMAKFGLSIYDIVASNSEIILEESLSESSHRVQFTPKFKAYLEENIAVTPGRKANLSTFFAAMKTYQMEMS